MRGRWIIVWEGKDNWEEYKYVYPSTDKYRMSERGRIMGR